jgi:TRAP-type transport system periplasmic protein
MNKGKWDALPNDMKKLFTDVSKEYMEKWALAFNEMDIEAIQFFKSQGGQIVTSPDAESARWVKAVEPVIGEYKKDLASKGYKEQEVDSWISYIKERIEYWKTQEKAKNIPTAYGYKCTCTF